MLMLVNFNNYIFNSDNECSWQETHLVPVMSDICYVLDTDDMCVEKIQQAVLISLISSGVVVVENAVISKSSGNLYSLHVGVDKQDMLGMSMDVKSLDGAIQYIVDHMWSLDGRDYCCGRMCFYNNEVEIFFSPLLDGRLQLTVNNKVLYCSEDYIASGAKQGVAYYFRLEDYIIVQYLYISYFAHCMTLVFTMRGDLVDVFTLDKEFFGEVNFQSLDSAFRTKYMMIYGGKF